MYNMDFSFPLAILMHPLVPFNFCILFMGYSNICNTSEEFALHVLVNWTGIENLIYLYMVENATCVLEVNTPNAGFTSLMRPLDAWKIICFAVVNGIVFWLAFEILCQCLVKLLKTGLSFPHTKDNLQIYY